MTRFLLTISTVIASISSSFAQHTPPDLPETIHRIPRTSEEMRVDGVLDEEFWSTAWTYELGVEVHPGENIPAVARTEVLMINTASHLVVGFRAYDPDPSKIRAHLSDRDQAWDDDWVGVVLDTFNDERRNYLLLVNPLGVQMDVIEAWPNGGGVWDGIWDSAARIADWGWSAEFKIPFSTLRFQRSEGHQTWGFDAVRGYPRNIFRQFGAFSRDRDNNCYLCQALKIQGFEGVSPGKNLEIVPTLTGSQTEHRDDLPDGPLENGDPDFEFGITGRWGFTPNMTLSATLNPDFSQVEADARQLAVNRPFAIYFPEKRPFFMEGADFFSTPLRTVYTRTMRDPSWGAKVTGKGGGHTVGAYVVNDDITNLIFPGSQGSKSESLDRSSAATVVRYKHDIKNKFTLGALYTARDGTGYSNEVGGFDADLRLTDKDRLVVQLLTSRTRYPREIVDEYDQPEGEFDDWAGTLRYFHDTRTWGIWGVYKDVGKDFRADLGFMPRVDHRGGEVGHSYVWIGSEDNWYSRLVLLSAMYYREDHSGNLLEHEYAMRFNYEGPLQTHAYIRPSLKREGYDGREFDLEELRFHICLKPTGRSHVFLDIDTGDAIDYDNTRPADRLNVNPGFWYRFGRHLRVEASYEYEKLDVEGGRLYDARIGQLTASWQFNARSFVRAIVQYVDNDFNVDLYEDDDIDSEQRELFTQLLFSYKLNPQTVFFLGYSDNSVANQNYSLTQEDRTVFVKLGYAWVL